MAVSCTGSGEYFIRLVVGHDVAARVRYQGASLEDAVRAVLARVGELGGTGGLIAVDKKGHVTLPFISEGMYRDVSGGRRLRSWPFMDRKKAVERRKNRW